MELRAYLDTLPRGGSGEFARKCGISEVYLYQLTAKQDGRQPSPRLSVIFERESGGLVTRQELRPEDYQNIWPDLQPLPPKVESGAAEVASPDRAAASAGEAASMVALVDRREGERRIGTRREGPTAAGEH
jgi:DNA-binding transcriptional regulator YdaS (Cro superfamily)